MCGENQKTLKLYTEKRKKESPVAGLLFGRRPPGPWEPPGMQMGAGRVTRSGHSPSLPAATGEKLSQTASPNFQEETRNVTPQLWGSSSRMPPLRTGRGPLPTTWQWPAPSGGLTTLEPDAHLCTSIPTQTSLDSRTYTGCLTLHFHPLGIWSLRCPQARPPHRAFLASTVRHSTVSPAAPPPPPPSANPTGSAQTDLKPDHLSPPPLWTPVWIRQKYILHPTST